VNRKIRIIWDFHGNSAEGTAKHHLRHLLQFMEKNNLELLDSGLSSAADYHHLAYITINETDVKVVRDALKPHRALVVE